MTDWQKGLQAFREGRMREAADRLSTAAAEEELTVSQTARFETCAYLGAALYSLGQSAEAVSAFEAAFRLSPVPVPPPDLSLNLAHAYLAAGRRDAAQGALQNLLQHFPGHVAARMLLQRLEAAPGDEPITGTIMGETVESVKRYLRTLTFATIASGGYDPAQVREALYQIEHYLDSLDSRIQSSQEAMAKYEEEIQRYRQMEDAMVQNIVQLQQEAQSRPPASEATQLSPIEILFQKKQ